MDRPRGAHGPRPVTSPEVATWGVGSTSRGRALIGAVLLLVAYLVLWYAAAPRYGELYNSRSFAHPKGSRHFTEVLYLRQGFGGSHLIGASSATPAYTVTSWRVLRRASDEDDPFVDDPGTTVRIAVTFRVNNCRAGGDWVPVTLHLRRWWINHSQTVVDHGYGFDGPDDACRGS